MWWGMALKRHLNSLLGVHHVKALASCPSYSPYIHIQRLLLGTFDNSITCQFMNEHNNLQASSYCIVCATSYNERMQWSESLLLGILETFFWIMEYDEIQFVRDLK